MLEIQVMAWDSHKNVAGLNQLMGFQPSQASKEYQMFAFLSIDVKRDLIGCLG
jgi:hypothetical protein